MPLDVVSTFPGAVVAASTGGSVVVVHIYIVRTSVEWSCGIDAAALTHHGCRRLLIQVIIGETVPLLERQLDHIAPELLLGDETFGEFLLESGKIFHATPSPS